MFRSLSRLTKADVIVLCQRIETEPFAPLRPAERQRVATDAVQAYATDLFSDVQVSRGGSLRRRRDRKLSQQIAFESRKRLSDERRWS